MDFYVLLTERYTIMFKKSVSIFLSFIFIITLIPVFSIPAFAEDKTESVAVTFEEIISAAATIVRQNEGSYASVNRDDNGALSIGWIQWHANRALNLLKTIVSANDQNAQTILGEALYNEIKTATSWTTRILTEDEGKKVSRLISTDEGKKAQDDLAAKDLSSYINRAVGYGITDPASLVYYADIENQCGSGGAKRVAVAAKELAGSYSAITLDIIHEAALADSIAGKYASRRQKTYNNCILLNWESTVINGEVWTATVNLNIRKDPGTQGELLTSIAKDMSIVIKEKAAVGTSTWGRTTMGWLSLDYCTINENFNSTPVPAPIVFDLQGGSFLTTDPVSVTASSLNTTRPANGLVVYNNDFDYDYALTNQYGGECTVDSTGKVISSPAFGVCKSVIPEGGIVISAHGTMYSWLYSNVKEGNYVSFNKDTLALTVYKNEASFLLAKASTVYGEKVGTLPSPKMEGYSFGGWLDSDGDSVSSETICESHLCLVLTASWRVAVGNRIVYDTNGGTIEGTAFTVVDGLNCHRGANQLILYNEGAATETNAFGNEAIIGADSRVVAVSGYGTGNSPIPEGGFVLSGHGTMDKWITENLAVGMIVEFDEYKNSITVYSSDGVYNSIHKAVATDEPIGTLPDVTKEYHKFLGWYTTSGEVITEDTLMPEAGLIIQAQWEVLPGSLFFDENGGVLGGELSSIAYSGVDIGRGANCLVIYRTRATTKTNSYGTEAIVGNDGIVDIVYPYGAGNCTVQKNTFVISGHGTASTWIKNNVKPGNYIEIGKQSISVWTDYDSYLASENTEVLYEKEYGDLPTVSKEGYEFLGWQDKNGNTVTEDSTVSLYGDVVLTAAWEKLVSVTFDGNEGQVFPYLAKARATGINVTRTGNTLVIYAGKSATGTNPYGTEAVIAPDGRVTAITSGKGNNAVPEGGFVISGHGTQSSWISKNITVGSYVKISGYDVYVYGSKALVTSKGNRIYVEADSIVGSLPTAVKSESTLTGWYVGDIAVSGSTVVTEDMTVTAKWTRSSASVIFDLQGGSFSGPSATVTANGKNISRPANNLIVFDSDYGNDKPATNAYGGEITVDADGRVTSAPVYGTCKTPIPKGGLVLSAHGTMYSWLSANIKEGYYVTFDKDTLEISVYKNYGDYIAHTGKTVYCNQPYGTLPVPTKGIAVFLGWKNSEGVLINEKTVVTSCDDTTLTAVWTKYADVSFDFNGGTLLRGSATLTGTNVSRPANGLVLYKNKATTGTNPYGTEAIINSDGIVITLHPYGKGNNPIPTGCFALSGNGTMSLWVQNNLKVGTFIKIDGNTVELYADKVSLDAQDGVIFVPEGAVIGTLPVPCKYGYTFDGWFANGHKLTEDTVITDDCSYSAHWTAKKIKVVFDANGGAFLPPVTTDVTGINVQRLTNALVLYDGSDGRVTTGTNIHGTEVAVDKNGVVISIRYYGNNNSEIPEGGFVLSGNGTASVWLKENVNVGNYVIYDGSSAIVYTDPAYAFAENGKTVTFGTAYGPLPVPQLNGSTFGGWYTQDGTEITESSILSHEGEPLVLFAKWTDTEEE